MINFYTILRGVVSTASRQLGLPQQCLCCKAPAMRTAALCEACEADLPWQPPSCSRCGLWQSEQITHSRMDNAYLQAFICMNCQHIPPAFDRCTSVFAYEAPISTMIKRFKEHAGFKEARCLAYLLQSAFRQHYAEQEIPPPAFLLPVPLHTGRLRKRGFNQSAILANTLSKRSGIPVLHHVCQRRASAHAQRGLNASARQENMRRVFMAGREIAQISQQHVAIIDDVVTTTATVSAMSDVLRSHGAATIDIWCIARANSF